MSWPHPSLSLKSRNVETWRRGDRSVAGAVVTKTRPAVILSSDIYHQSRPDVLLGLITSQKPARSAPTDCIVRD
jgi:mRNA-degrading endonuclease toxin of MazEF toxin-antitoxin module